MKKRLALLLAALMLLTSVSVFSVSAAEVVTDKIVADFETEESRNMVASGAYNFFNPTYEASADVKGSGESAVRIKFGELVDTLQDVRLKFAEAKELEKVEYITFYIKNECDLPLDVKFAASCFIVNEHLEDVYDGMKDYPNETYFLAHDTNIKAQVKAVGSDEWTEAAAPDGSASNFSGGAYFMLPANFEGYVKFPLGDAERVQTVEGETVSLKSWGVGFRFGAGFKSETPDKTQFTEYNNGSVVIDDIAFGVSEKVVVPQPEAPEGLAGVAPTSTDNNDGKITGASDKMEYRKEGATDYTAATGAEITGLAAGNYFVRLKADGDTPAGKDAAVTVPAYIPPKAQDYLRMINDFETASKVEEIKGVEYTFLGGADLVPSKAAHATGSQSAMISLKADTQNGFQKILISTPTGDLTNASFYQMYMKWTGNVAITFNTASADAEMATPAWYNRMKKENPTEFDKDDFWKKHIIIGGNVGANLVGVACPKIEILKDGKWVETTELPAKFEGLVRFAVPDMSKRTDRHGFGLTLQCADENLSGDLYFDDLMVGMTAVDAAAGYDVKMTDYAAEAGIKYDGAADPKPTPGTGDSSVVLYVVVFFMVAASAAVVLCTRKARAK